MGHLVLALALLFTSVSALAAAMPKPKVVKLTERVYALLGPEELPNKANRGYMVNSALVIGDKGAILIDTGFSREIGVHLRDAVAKLTPKPVTHVINTHYHGDHYLGNAAFPEATIISSEQARDVIVKDGFEAVALGERMTGLKFTDTKPIPATTTYKEATRTEVTLDGVKLVLWVPKGSHTPGDLLVYLPDDAVLVGGDVLVSGVMPNFREGNIRTWIDTLNQAQSLPFKTAIPGHGPLMTRADVGAMQKRMSSLYAEVEAGYKQGLSDSEIRKKMDLSEWKRLKRFDEMGANINRVYLEVEAANF